ncbi:hypothetical protein BKA70DRAFT_1397561 [Coprinopsis sp. MPI-PUGE-AT-0042]|nr:hypothetical protein BKA70DRAFT_1397561 [Coprinopsis sp. MPI-PUGE-AT-0042]
MGHQSVMAAPIRILLRPVPRPPPPFDCNAYRHHVTLLHRSPPGEVVGLIPSPDCPRLLSSSSSQELKKLSRVMWVGWIQWNWALGQTLKIFKEIQKMRRMNPVLIRYNNPGCLEVSAIELTKRRSQQRAYAHGALQHHSFPMIGSYHDSSNCDRDEREQRRQPRISPLSFCLEGCTLLVVSPKRSVEPTPSLSEVAFSFRLAARTLGALSSGPPTVRLSSVAASPPQPTRPI